MARGVEAWSTDGKLEEWSMTTRWMTGGVEAWSTDSMLEASVLCHSRISIWEMGIRKLGLRVLRI